MSERWLRCTVLKGMFSDERAVLYSKNGSEFSFFVPTDRVLGDVDREGKVRVRVFSDDGGWWAVMPNENQTIIPVSEADLTPAYAGAAVDRHAAGISASPESRWCATT